MPFGPAWRAMQHSPAGDVVGVVEAAARRFLADVDAARSATRDWIDEGFAQPLVDAALDRLLATLAGTGLWGRDNQGPSQILWQRTHDVLALGDLQRRARDKPAGYAGDDRMILDIWRRRQSTHPLGRLFDRYFLKQAAVEAVRARMEQSAALVVERALAAEDRALRVVSVGSGPAIELLMAAEALPEAARRRLRCVLIDLDEAALNAACERLSAVLSPEQTSIYRENLNRLAKLPRGAQLVAEADVILCLGLFDYFADDAAASMLRLFHGGLRSGGMAVVGNFAPHCPTRAYMEWLGNWYLTYRTAEEMDGLAAAAGLRPADYRIAADRTGCDLFMIAEKLA